jgi:hypothetical protein
MHSYGSVGVALWCLLTFHAPDHSPLFVESAHIVAVRPDGFLHFQKHVNTVLYTTDKNFAILEKADDVVKMIEGCNH